MTRRDVPKKGFAKRHAERRWMLLAILLVALVGISGGVWFYLQRTQVTKVAELSAAVSRGMHWMTERKDNLKTRLVSKVEKVKRIAHQDDQPPEINFEFYTALQTMQVGSNAPLKMDEKAVTAAGDEKKSKPVIPEAARKPSATSDLPFMSQTELEKDFSRQLIRDAYVIQVGVFSSDTAAEQYCDTLEKAGYEVEIIKSAGAKALYRVQVGPFVSKDKAVATQKKLQKSGVEGVLRQVELS